MGNLRSEEAALMLTTRLDGCLLNCSVTMHWIFRLCNDEWYNYVDLYTIFSIRFQTAGYPAYAELSIIQGDLFRFARDIRYVSIWVFKSINRRTWAFALEIYGGNQRNVRGTTSETDWLTNSKLIEINFLELSSMQKYISPWERRYKCSATITRVLGAVYVRKWSRNPREVSMAPISH
jgi:hypothetical protein